jgi:hypothetical protein
MESSSSYFRRKSKEVDIIRLCLDRSLRTEVVCSVEEIVQQKLELSIRLKAELANSATTLTETNVRNTAHKIGPFTLNYGYQRADLKISGPEVYPWLDRAPATTFYASCGMAAVSSLLIAINRVWPAADIVAPLGLYNETMEVIERCCPGLRIRSTSSERTAKVLVLDSSVEWKLFDPDLVQSSLPYQMLILDTTCLSLNSGRIKLVLCWAKANKLPAVLVRSHTKLDSFGIEYGRLGSAVFVKSPAMDTDGMNRLEELIAATQDSIRLLGAAAIPAHLPPFFGSSEYHHVSQQRIAAILNNGRFINSFLKERRMPVKRYQHGLFCVLCPPYLCGVGEAKELAADLSRRLRLKGLPVKYAGSFGFDFSALDAFPNGAAYGTRLTFPDAPSATVKKLAEEISSSWIELGLVMDTPYH